MNADKLKKEAEEYFKSICEDYNEEYERTGKRHYFVGFDIKNAYLASAEPREKRIAELEKENKVLTQNLEDTEIVNKALEKENKRLTDELKSLRESIKDYGAGCYENGLRNGKRKLEGQLTKAKELLKKWVELFKPKVGNIPPTPIQLETEQFLSEVEK